jgi:uncharacterized membrane protein
VNTLTLAGARAGFWRAFRRYFMAGLLIWIPIIATVVVVRFILGMLDDVTGWLPRQWQLQAITGLHVPGAGALLALAILLLTGLLVTNFIGRWLVDLWEELMHRIPFVRAIYGGVKSFSESLLSNKGSSFKKVLLVQYPRAGMWSVGFQTASDIPEITARTGAPQVCVFIPTTPNPTSGFIVMVPRSEVIELSMSTDEAMKLIVTLGVVTPHVPAAPVAVAPATPGP